MLISFEGGEGAGKSSQIALLAKSLDRLGYRVVATREPGGTPIAERIRRLILSGRSKGMDAYAETLLYAAARAEHSRRLIGPALANGAVVLCDRYSDATIAYQGYGRGLAIEKVKRICRIAEGGNRPALTVLLDINPRVGLLRAKRRGRITRFEREALQFHQRVRRGYLDLAAKEPGRFVVVGATGRRAAIARRILDETVKRLPGRR